MRLSPAPAAELAPEVWATVLLAALAALLLGGWWGPVRFVSEQVTVTAGGPPGRGLVEVEGLYEYRNLAPWPAALRLGIPFPVDLDHPPPVGLALDLVRDGDGGLEPLTPVVHGDDVSVRLLFRPRQALRLRLHYLQPSAVPRGRYLLTTTRAWGRPVGRATFELSLPAGTEQVSSSYGLQPLPARGGRARYGFERAGFWPDRDWDFAWAPPAAAGEEAP